MLRYSLRNRCFITRYNARGTLLWIIRTFYGCLKMYLIQYLINKVTKLTYKTMEPYQSQAGDKSEKFMVNNVFRLSLTIQHKRESQAHECDLQHIILIGPGKLHMFIVQLKKKYTLHIHAHAHVFTQPNVFRFKFRFFSSVRFEKKNERKKKRHSLQRDTIEIEYTAPMCRIKFVDSHVDKPSDAYCLSPFFAVQVRLSMLSYLNDFHIFFCSCIY